MKNILIFIIVIVFLLFFLLIIKNNNQLDITGAITGTASVQVAGIVSITLTTNSVNFGIINPGSTDNTLDNAPLPFVIENTGNVAVNITIARGANSTALFNGTGGGDDSQSFQFMPGIAESNSYDVTCSPSNWTNVPGTTSILAVCKLDSPTPRDSVEIDLKVNVPSDESVGTKSEILNFIGYQA